MLARSLPLVTVAAVLALAGGCVPDGIAPPAPSSQLRTPQPPPFLAGPTPDKAWTGPGTGEIPAPAPTSTPAPPASPAVTGHVTVPAGVLADPLGLAATDGQDRLSIANSGLLVNTGQHYGLLQAASATAPVAGALVVVTDLDQRAFAGPSGEALSATTDASGAFRLPGVPPAGTDAIVVAFPSGSQRLTALLGAGTTTVEVDLASTLATELLRNEARLAGRTPSSYAAADFAALVSATRGAIADGTITAVTTATDDAGKARAATIFDLRLDQAQALRNQYAVALSAVAATETAIKGLSDGWKALIGHRPRAITTRLGNGREPVVGGASVEGDQPAGAIAAAPQAVPLGDPTAVAVSKRGDVFVACGTASPAGGYVRWIQPNGRVTSIALPVTLQAPAGLAIEREPDGNGGTLLVADEAANLVWRLAIAEPGAASATATPVAGEDVPLGARADEPDHPGYVDGPQAADGSQPATSRWRLADEGARTYTSNHNPIPAPARYARLSRPGALALDELGNLYIADRGNQRIRMIPAAGGPAFGYRTPIDADGNGVADGYGPEPASLAGGAIYTIAGAPAWDPTRTPLATDGHWFGDFAGDGGPAQQARLDEPSGLAFFAGYLYVADRENQRVRRISRATGMIETVAGMPPGAQVATRALHDGRPTDFAFPPGTAGDGGPAAAAQLSYPWGLAVDARDPAHARLYVADAGSGHLRVIDLADPTHPIVTLAGRTHDALGASDRVDHDRDGEAIAYADLFETRGIAVDANGNLLFADGRHRRLRELWLQWD